MPILQEKKRKKHNPLRVVTNLLRTPLFFFPLSLSLSFNHAFPMRSKTCKHKQNTVATENPPKTKPHAHTNRDKHQRKCLSNHQQETTCTWSKRQKTSSSSCSYCPLLSQTSSDFWVALVSVVCLCVCVCVCVCVFWGLLASKTNNKLWLLVSVNCDATHQWTWFCSSGFFSPDQKENTSEEEEAHHLAHCPAAAVVAFL